MQDRKRVKKMTRPADVVSVASPKMKMRMATTVGYSATTASSGTMCYVFPLVMRYQTGMTIVMRMMCLTGSAMFAHDKMCIPKCFVRVML